mmetsp:Transcript_21662/g.24175  ORF Transcript_21662/g.24175 Transcript_21662/m.24175 type:complete len:654 (-) Transcript_21662:71-2032(-)
MATPLQVTLLLLSLVFLASTQPWQDLRDVIGGNVLLPGDIRYDNIKNQVLILPNDVPDGQPRAIIQAVSSQDVSEVMKFAKKHDIEQVTALAGGHGSDGFSLPSDGVQIDFSLMKSIVVDPTNKYVEFEPGVLVGNITQTLGPLNLGQAQGNCAAIGYGGFLSYGGYGGMFRTQGLAIDAVLEYEVVVANGDIVVANENTNSELFFALRGALPSFGIVTRFKIKVFDATNFYGGHIFYRLPEAEATQFQKDWFNTVLNTPDLINDENFMTRVSIQRDRDDMTLRYNLEIIFFGPDSVATKKMRLLPLINVDAIDFYPEYIAVDEPPLWPQDYEDYHTYMFEDDLIRYEFVNVLQGYYRHGMVSNSRISQGNVLDTLVDGYMPGFDVNNPITLFQFGELSIAGGKATTIASDETAFYPRENFDFFWGFFTAYLNTPFFDLGRTFYDGLADSLVHLSQDRGIYGNLNTIKFARPFDGLGTNLPKLERLKSIWDPDNQFQRSWNISTSVGGFCAHASLSSIVIIDSVFLRLSIYVDTAIDLGDLTTTGFLSLGLYDDDLKNIGLFNFESWDNAWSGPYTIGSTKLWRYSDGLNRVHVIVHDGKSIIKVRVKPPRIIPQLPIDLPLYARLETGSGSCIDTTFSSGTSAGHLFVATHY